MTELFDNIRSLYQFKAPCEELKNYIEFFSESCFKSTKQIVGDQPFSIKMFRSWTPTFWINLGPSYHLILDGRAYRIKSNTAIAVSRAVTAERINQASDHLFTVKFSPGALNHLIGVNLTRLHSGIVELNELLPPLLVQQIKSVDCFEQRISLMEKHLLQSMPNKETADHYTQLVTQTIAFYEQSGMRFNVNELAFKSFTCSKTLKRYFERVIGVSPKKYFESIRMRNALPAFLGNRKQFDPVEYGFHDSSHFYRSVASFTGERIAEHS